MKQAKRAGGLIVATFTTLAGLAGLIGCSGGTGSQDNGGSTSDVPPGEVAAPGPTAPIATPSAPSDKASRVAAPRVTGTGPFTAPPTTPPNVPSPVLLGAMDYGTPMSFTVADKAARVITFEGVAGDDIDLSVALAAGAAPNAVITVSLADPTAAILATGSGGALGTVTLPSDGVYTIVVKATVGASIDANVFHVAKGITCFTTITPALPGSCMPQSITESNVVATLADAPARLTLASTGISIAAGMGLGPPRSPTDFTGTLPVLDQFAGGAPSSTTSATVYGDGAVRVSLGIVTTGVQPGGPPGQPCRVTFLVHCTGLGKL